jgi:hypothetical protein
MSAMASLWKRLKRLEQKREAEVPSKFDQLLREVPIEVLLELTTGGPHIEAMLLELLPVSATMDDAFARVLEMLVAETRSKQLRASVAAGLRPSHHGQGLEQDQEGVHEGQEEVLYAGRGRADPKRSEADDGQQLVPRRS